MSVPFASFLLKKKQNKEKNADSSKPAMLCTGKGRCITDTLPDDESRGSDEEADAQVVM